MNRFNDRLKDMVSGIAGALTDSSATPTGELGGTTQIDALAELRDRNSGPPLYDVPVLNRALRRAMGAGSPGELQQRFATTDPEDFAAEVRAAEQKLTGRAAVHGYMADDPVMTYIPK